MLRFCTACPAAPLTSFRPATHQPALFPLPSDSRIWCGPCLISAARAVTTKVASDPLERVPTCLVVPPCRRRRGLEEPRRAHESGTNLPSRFSSCSISALCRCEKIRRRRRCRCSREVRAVARRLAAPDMPHFASRCGSVEGCRLERSSATAAPPWIAPTHTKTRVGRPSASRSGSPYRPRKSHRSRIPSFRSRRCDRKLLTDRLPGRRGQITRRDLRRRRPGSARNTISADVTGGRCRSPTGRPDPGERGQRGGAYLPRTSPPSGDRRCLASRRTISWPRSGFARRRLACAGARGEHSARRRRRYGQISMSTRDIYTSDANHQSDYPVGGTTSGSG